MKNLLLIIVIFFSVSVFGQQMQVDTQTYSAQQLIENVLVNSACISNVVVTNVVGGNFNSTDKSFGYFNASGTTFPFAEGLVLSTGKLANVPGPNTSLSDDDATNWVGDSDLEQVLNESNTTNATIIEFDFVSITNQISFNYIFASEEYQENNANTCKYSDLFGFLIRPKNSANYTNIALVPNTETPVKVTTVHPVISGGCAAQNEQYFESWNNSSAPINFNGQTKALTATASVIPNEIYHVKLVIADEQNYRYDSAVFIEAGSFQLSTNLGEDRLFLTNNPVCENTKVELNAEISGTIASYKWFKDGVEIPLETSSIYTAIETGFYEVEVTIGINCISKGTITLEYDDTFNTKTVFLSTCDNDTDELSFFDLTLADQFFMDYSLNYSFAVIGYYLSEDEAIKNTNPIPTPKVFFNTVPNQILYARLENNYGCIAVESINLSVNYTSMSIKTFEACDADSDGFTTFNLAELRTLIALETTQGYDNISFYPTYNDAASSTNELPNLYVNSIIYTEEIFVKSQDIWCDLYATVTLNVVEIPELLPNEELIYCAEMYPEMLTINAGLLNGAELNGISYKWFKNGVAIIENTAEIEVNETGSYTVVVLNSVNCTVERSIEIVASEKATIQDIIVTKTSTTNTIEVVAVGNGIYEYALDTGIGNFQDSSIFLNVSAGNHTVFVNDVNSCGISSQLITVLGFPKFFTPNNDGFNDVWKPLGFDENNILEISIFDRFGKVLKVITANGEGWDGTFNGFEMPSADYWYKTVINNEIITAHFTLKR